MGGDTLVQVEELVGLGTAARAVARQVLEATPLPLVRCHERVKIHAHTVFAATPYGGLARYAGRIMGNGTGMNNSTGMNVSAP